MKRPKQVDSLHWYTIYYDINARKITVLDIFHHETFKKEVATLYRKSDDFDEFKKQLNRIVKYYFWSKCEYEILISGWPPIENRPEEIKTDVSEQIDLNYDVFSKYVWDTLSGR